MSTSASQDESPIEGQGPEQSGPDSDGRTSKRELLLLAAILVLATLLRSVYAPVDGFDRGMDGFQGSFFSLTSVNYERLGTDAVGAYPVAGVDLDTDEPASWYVYANHPPTLALALWWNQRLLAPALELDDPGAETSATQASSALPWQTAHELGLPPTDPASDGFEQALRLPMYLASLLSILALWWALRANGQRAQALLAAFLYAIAPLAVLEAGLVNYEPPSILAVILAHGCLARYLVGERPRMLVATALFLALGTAQTFAPLFFAVPLCLFALQHVGRRRGPRAGIRVAGLLGASALLPILVHATWARRSLEGIGEVPHLIDRIGILFEPLTSGTLPLWTWLRLQFTHLAAFNSALLVDLALLGLVFALLDLLATPSLGEQRASSAAAPEGESAALGSARAELRERQARSRSASLALLLFAGGFSVLFFYYRHTSDGHLPGTSAQDTFMLNLLPGAAALGALALVQVASTLRRVLTRGRPDQPGLRRHIGPLLAGLVVLLTLNSNLARCGELWERWRDPELPGSPLPKATGTTLAELLPAGAIGLHPEALGWTPAVSLYAWRTLLPVNADPASFEFAAARLIDAKLDERPRYLVLPTEPPPGAVEQVAALRELFAATFPEIAARQPAEADGWQAWHLIE